MKTGKDKNKQVAILLTCHNRKEKTLACLNSLYFAIAQVYEYDFDTYLVDDGSTDGTSNAIQTQYPNVNLIDGNGSLFWAGGMRLAWRTAMEAQNYDAYLLLNDDVVLDKAFINNILTTNRYSLKETGKRGIYCGTTIDKENGLPSYGGRKIIKKGLIVRTILIDQNESPQKCNLANANILWICSDVVEQIGLFDNRFTHCFADFDYTLTAFEHKIPLWVVPGVSGYCNNDHGKSWKSADTTFRERIVYLKSPKGLAYDEYLYYISKHFPLNYPYSFFMIWIKTLFPFLWDYFKPK